MVHVAAFTGVQARSSFFTGAQLHCRQTIAARPAARSLTISASYKGKGTDLSLVEGFKAHANDSGSAAVQVAQLSARVQQLTSHLQQHKKDFSTRRGLMAILSQRKQMLMYLQRTDQPMYERCLSELNIRAPKSEASR